MLSILKISRLPLCFLFFVVCLFGSVVVFTSYGNDTADTPTAIDTQGIDLDFSKLMQAYAEFGNMYLESGKPYFTITKNQISYESDIKNEITIDIELSRTVLFHASYPLVEGFAQQAVNEFIDTQLLQFRIEAQRLLKNHRCYYSRFRELPCPDNTDRSFHRGVYITGKAWNTVTTGILNVHFKVEVSVGNAYSGDNTVMIFDATNGRALSYDAIFTSSDDALGIIAALSVQQYQLLFMNWEKEQGREGSISSWKDFYFSYAREGTSPTWKNYRSMAFDVQGNLIVFFDKYQIGPGVIGSIEVKINSQDIQHLLKTKP